MITEHEMDNATRIVELSNTFGHLAFNEQGQTPNHVLNLSIPCAVLILAGIVTEVADTNDGVNDNAVVDCEAYCRYAIEYQTHLYGYGWWNTLAAKKLNLS